MSMQPDQLATPFDAQELAILDNSFPLLQQFSPEGEPDPVLSEWALIFRDHFVEDTLATILAFGRLGIPPEFMLVLDKGDSTAKPERIAATLANLGIGVDLFDNKYPNVDAEIAATTNVRERVHRFIDQAHAAGKKTLLIDDGLLLLDCLSKDQSVIGGVIELTVSGLKRLQSLPSIEVPVYNLAETELKQRLLYPAIAESCVRRITELTGESLAGKNTVLVGYGHLGRLVAGGLRNQGAIVNVTDIEPLAKLEAQQHGFTTYDSPEEAVIQAQPHLLLGCAGEQWLTWDIIDDLPNDTLVTAIATKDLVCLTEPPAKWQKDAVPHKGSDWRSNETSKRVIQLGEGRSINLYESESVPNEEIDIFKAAIVIAALDLCRRQPTLDSGIHLDLVDQSINHSGLYSSAYQLRRLEK